MKGKTALLTGRDQWFKDLHGLESQLLDSSVRTDSELLASILSDDFVEFGSSGRVYTKEMLIEMMTGEAQAPVLMRDFSVRKLGDTTALVTYRTVGQSGQEARRSSVWSNTKGGWKMVFHQGTRIPNSWGHVG